MIGTVGLFPISTAYFVGNSQLSDYLFMINIVPFKLSIAANLYPMCLLHVYGFLEPDFLFSFYSCFFIKHYQSKASKSDAFICRYKVFFADFSVPEGRKSATLENWSSMLGFFIFILLFLLKLDYFKMSPFQTPSKALHAQCIP